MIKTLENFSIVDVLSDSLKNDNNIRNLAIALTPIFQRLLEQTQLVQMYKGIPDHLLDFIAYEVAADFYDVNMTNNQKRVTLENAEAIHKSKGTVASVEDVIAPFFNTGRVREWFQYDGKPYHFQVIANEYLENEADIAKLFRMVDIVKRESTRLDCVIYERKDGIIQEAVQTDKHIEIYPLTDTFFCGQWYDPAIFGRLIESGVNVRTDSIDNMIIPFKQTNTFFLNSNESPEMIQRDFNSFVQLDRAPIDYSKVDYLFANDKLMIGKFKTGSTEITEPIQLNYSDSINMRSIADISLQEEFAKTGQFFVGSKEEFEIIQKEYKDSLEISTNKDMSFVEYIASREDLNLNFIVGSKEEFQQTTVSANDSVEVEGVADKTATKYPLAGQFYASEE